jgi:sec-independent protein translocase protein TatA
VSKQYSPGLQAGQVGQGEIMGPMALMGPLGLPELVIILFIVVLIFGANRLPQLATGIGKSIRNFKDGMKEGDEKKDS